MHPYNVIKNAIVTGEYPPGKRLTEEALAEVLNISRTPIREAIKQLESDGLVTPLKRGVIVSEFTKDDILQIYNIRALLESYAASEASIRRSTEDLKIIEESNEEYEQAINQYQVNNTSAVESIIKSNRKFHEAVIKASKNDYLRFHISKVVVVPLVHKAYLWYEKEDLIQSITAHKAVYKAIKDQDFERAKTVIRAHVFYGGDHILKHFEKM